MFSSRVSPGVLVLVISMHADGLAALLDLRLQRPRSRNRMFSSRVSPGVLVRVISIHADGLAALHSLGVLNVTLAISYITPHSGTSSSTQPDIIIFLVLNTNFNLSDDVLKEKK
jgi:hypothetical protein